jgi:DNA-binding NarL/FixJ family response regulator
VTIRVLLADDQKLIRAGFRALVDSASDLTVPGRGGNRAGGGRARSPCPGAFRDAGRRK